MAKKATFTDEQREAYAKLAAEGMSHAKIARELGVTEYIVRKMRHDYETCKAIDRVRLTDTIPTRLERMTDVMSGMIDMIAGMQTDMCDVRAALKKLNKAMHRLQVENKDLRQTRKEARQQVRELRRELWKARGY